MPSPFTKSNRAARVLSAIHLPFFQLRPPRDYGILTATGRKTGKRRSRCVRMVRRGDKAYLVAIKGAGTTGWARNILANPRVKVRLRDGRFDGRARELRPEEQDAARDAYGAGVHWFERLEWINWRSDSFSPEKSRQLHRKWFDTGTPLVIELADRPDRSGR
jgi:deazaflavin-dependent oxidoreductase (nitroreductase family)